MTLVIVTSDDKVTGVLGELEEGDVMKKGQAIVSPLLNGKREYMKWVQESLNSVKATAASALLDTAGKDWRSIIINTIEKLWIKSELNLHS